MREELVSNVKAGEGNEWTPNSKRVGLLARKLGMLPQWLNNGTRVLCTMLEFPENCVVSAIDPETWYRYDNILFWLFFIPSFRIVSVVKYGDS